MRDLGFFLRLFASRRLWMTAGTAISLLALLAGIGLIAVSGWFLTATALAAASGVLAFNVYQPAAVIRALALLRTVAKYGDRIVNHEATFRLLADLRVWFFRAAIPLAPSRLSLYRSGDLAARITADIDALDSLFLRILVPGSLAIVTLVISGLLLSLYSSEIAVSVVLALVVVGFALPFALQRKTVPIGRDVTRQAAELRTRTVDIVQGLPELEAYRLTAEHRDAIRRIDDAYIESQRRISVYGSASSAAIGLAVNLAVALVLVLGTPLVRDGKLNGPLFAMIVFLTMALFDALGPLPSAFQHLGRLAEAGRRLLEIAKSVPAAAEPAAEVAVSEAPGTHLLVRGLTFRYPGAPDPALSGIDLDLPRGRRLAILGPSGAGKSTLFNLLLRFDEPSDGTIEIGGTDVRRMPTAAVQACFGVMTQRVHLFDGTIRDNLLLGRPDANDEELMHALRAARLERLVAILPEGLDSWVGEDGVRLSGGEARRLALARVYLRDAPILLLDEPTEGLDDETEREVLSALAGIMTGKTVIYITHRSAGLGSMDEIVVLERGRIVARTTPEMYSESVSA
jgi:ATP-binding cassette subfamily C protein CydC